MIQANELTKLFDHYAALDRISLSIEPGTIYGLVGTNGSGKSTLLRLISGVFRQDLGTVTLDGEAIYENPEQKKRTFFVSDDLFFPQQATLSTMMEFYRAYYRESWSQERFERLCQLFPIGQKKKLSTFSKGMRRQAALILALSSAPDYLLLDEAFDGLDPVIRHAVRKLISDLISEKGMTVVISSHNLRELEDFCDGVGLLHKGHLLLECAIDKIQLGFCKVQAVFRPMPQAFEPLESVRVLSRDVSGSVATFICAAGEGEALAAIEQYHPVLAESIPLTLEELFIYEMEAVGYDYSKIIF